MVLPVQVIFHSDETPLSLTSRLAAVNGYRSLDEFLRFSDVDARSLQTGAPEAIFQLSRWSGIEVARLVGNVTSAASPGGSWRLGSAMMSKDMRPGRTHRFCRKCIMEDIENRGDRLVARPYVRSSWMTRALAFCPEHRCEIAEIEADANSAGDFPRFIADHFHEVEAANDMLETVSVKIDEYVVARIRGAHTNDFLDSLEAYVAIDLCRYLGRFEKQHRNDSGVKRTDSDLELGFAWASRGRLGIEELVSEAVERVRPIAHEMNDFFGDLRKWLKRNRDKEEYSPLVELFQDIAERYLPIGPDDLFLKPTRKRHLHSVRSASAEFGITEERVVDLLSQAGLMEPSSSLTSSQIFLDVEKAYPILKEAADALTTGEMSKLLGVTVDRMLAIVSADLIPCVETRDESGRVFTRVRRRDFDAFRQRLQGRPATLNELDGRHSIFRVTRVCSCKIEEILKLAVEGRISLLRSGGDELGKLWIDPVELRTQLGRERAHASDITNLDLLNIRQAERRLKLASGSAAELIKRALIETQFAENPETCKWQAYVKAASVEDFARKHLSINQLSERTGVFPTKLRKALENHGVHPIFVPKGRVSWFYRRSDVKDFIATLAA